MSPAPSKGKEKEVWLTPRPPGESADEWTLAGAKTRRFVECDFSWSRVLIGAVRELWQWLTQPR